MTTQKSVNPLGPGYEGVPGEEKRFRDVFRDTLRAEMIRDEDVFLMGEDISGGFDKETKEPLDAWGGPFAATKGLVQEFGPERIRDTPISEAGFVGVTTKIGGCRFVRVRWFLCGRVRCLLFVRVRWF